MDLEWKSVIQTGLKQDNFSNVYSDTKFERNWFMSIWTCTTITVFFLVISFLFDKITQVKSLLNSNCLK